MVKEYGIKGTGLSESPSELPTRRGRDLQLTYIRVLRYKSGIAFTVSHGRGLRYIPVLLPKAIFR